MHMAQTSNVHAPRVPIMATPPIPEAIRDAMLSQCFLTVPGGTVIGFGVARVGPDQARLVIGKNYRSKRLHRVAYYARLMTAGAWRLTPQSLVFFSNGERGDGDHRLSAIIESGVSTEFLVTWGWSADIVSVLDVGLPRNSTDFVKAVLDVNWSAAELGAVRTLSCGLEIQKNAMIGNEVMAELSVVLQAGIDFAMQSFKTAKRAGIYNSDVLAVIAAAYFTYPDHHESIGRFCEILGTGKGVKYLVDNVALVTRNALASLTGRHAGDDRNERIAKAHLGLRHFLEQNEVTILRPPRITTRVGTRLFDISAAIHLPQEIRNQLNAVLKTELLSESAETA